MGCCWSANAHELQWRADWFVSWVINNNKIRKQPRWNKPSRVPATVMESFFKPLSGRSYMNVYKPNKTSEEYNQYVQNMEQYIDTTFSNERPDIPRPSELYFDDFNLQQNIVPISKSDGISKSDWSDKVESNIMKGRHSSIGCDYLTAI